MAAAFLYIKPHARVRTSDPVLPSLRLTYRSPPRTMSVFRAYVIRLHICPCKGFVLQANLALPTQHDSFKREPLPLFTARQLPVLPMPIPVHSGPRTLRFVKVSDIPALCKHIPFVPENRLIGDDYPGVSIFDILLNRTTVVGDMDSIHLLTGEPKISVVFWVGLVLLRLAFYLSCGAGERLRARRRRHLHQLCTWCSH